VKRRVELFPRGHISAESFHCLWRKKIDCERTSRQLPKAGDVFLNFSWRGICCA
jgi:hypothetical protein